MSNDILVIHPGLQHSHQLAWALYEAGRLQELWTGIPVRGPEGNEPVFLRELRLKRLKSTGIPNAHRRVFPIWYVLLKAATRFGNPETRSQRMHEVLWKYDEWVAPKANKRAPRFVVGYENSSRHTFRICRKSGIHCVLDAASLHYSEQNNQNKSQYHTWHTIRDAIKQEEIDLADTIICCSTLAAESYVKAGVSPDKIKVVSPGATLPANIVRSRHGLNTSVQFVFAGCMRQLKSIDLILQVFEELERTDKSSSHLNIYGGSDDRKWIEQANRLSNVTYHGQVSQDELYQALAKMDCLLLPSRFESFGMVTVEAMATGTPAIVSRMAGSRAVVEQHPGSGWLVEPTYEDLRRCVNMLIQHPELLDAASERAILAAQSYTWKTYRSRTVELFTRLSGK